MRNNKDIVIGLGEIGNPILKLLLKKRRAVGYDINSKLVNWKQFQRLEKYKTQFMHICIPYSDNFINDVIKLQRKFNSQLIVIHSTVKPNTTKKIQSQLLIPIIYSAVRGIHRRMLSDLKRYTKFFAIENTAPRRKWASSSFAKTMKSCGIKTKQMSSPITLELAKIVCDTSYYGWLINYAQISKIIAMNNNVDYDEMWLFSDEIHKYLGNRPKLFPGFIGGHCVIPNLSLLDYDILNTIKDVNSKYSKIAKIEHKLHRKELKNQS